MSTNIQLDGAQSAASSISKKQNDAETIEIVTQMAMPLEPSVEIPIPSRDIKNQAAITKKELNTAELTKAETTKLKRQANAKYARERKAELKRLKMESGSTAAKGTPAPDLLSEFSKTLMNRFDKMDATINERLRALPIHKAQENNQDAKTVSSSARIAPDVNNVIIHPTPAVQLTATIPPNATVPTNSYQYDQRQRAKRFNQLFDNIDFTPTPAPEATTKNSIKKANTFFF